MKSVIDTKSVAISPSDSEGEWQPLTDAQISAWAAALRPYAIRSIVVYWGQEVEARRFFKSLQAVGRKINVPVTAGGGSADGNEVGIITPRSDSVGEILLELFRGLGCAASLDHYQYESDKNVGIFIPDRDGAFSPTASASPKKATSPASSSVSVTPSPSPTQKSPTPEREAGPKVVPPKAEPTAGLQPMMGVVPPKQFDDKGRLSHEEYERSRTAAGIETYLPRNVQDVRERSANLLVTLTSRITKLSQLVDSAHNVLESITAMPEKFRHQATKQADIARLFEIDNGLIEESLRIYKETDWIAFHDLWQACTALNRQIGDYNMFPTAERKDKIRYWILQIIPSEIAKADIQSSKQPS